eukprot:scaffold13342_cov67-Cyclotella_meneghiniana.AAC.5
MAIGAKDIGAIIISSIQEMVIYPTTDEQEVMTTRMTGTEETVDQERVEGGAGLARDLVQGQGTDTAVAVDLT